MAKASPARSKPERTAARRDSAHVLLRLPRRTKVELDALCGLTGRSISTLVTEAIATYVRALPAAERRLLRRVKERRATMRRTGRR